MDLESNLEMEEARRTPTPPPAIASAVAHQSSCFHCAPEVIWEHIFEALEDDPVALMNCYLASPKWARILTKQKTQFMLHLVQLGITFISKVVIMREKVLSLVAKLYPFTSRQLKYCRLVSRNWKKAVDYANDYNPELLPWYSCMPANALFPRPRRQNAFRGCTEFVFKLGTPEWPNSLGSPIPSPETLAIMNDLRTRFANPFPTRVVHFETYLPAVILNSDLSYKHDHKYAIHPDYSLGWFRECLEIDKCFHKMLESVGKHIYHLRYTISWDDDHKNFCRNVVKILRLVPNLRSLSLEFRSRSEDTGFNCPAPDLPNLVAVHMPGIDAFISKFLLASYGHQLETLGIDFFNNDEPFVIILPKLKKISIRQGEKYLSKLGSMLVAPRIQRLSINLEVWRFDASTLWSLMVGLENYSSSLERLCVKVNCPKFSANDLPEKSCTTLEAERGHSIRQFERLKSLKVNHVFVTCPDLEWFCSKFPVLDEICFTDYIRDVCHLFGVVPSLQKIFMAGWKIFEANWKKWERINDQGFKEYKYDVNRRTF